ncbi:MAG TPA: hypothetical protein ENK86_00955 [Campylobacterales bacterium]|nr:hypothetical protein [Campylobacterales bacterium]
MEDKNTKRYMELQMEELKETYGVDKEVQPRKPKNTSGNPKDAEIAELYEDAWEYEEELVYFENALEIIEANSTAEMVAALSEAFPEEKNFDAMLRGVVASAWAERADRLTLIEAIAFSEIVTTLQNSDGDYEGNFEEEVKEVVVNAWKTHIAVKKDHIKEESNYIKALGLKPHYAKKIYKRYHGIE